MIRMKTIFFCSGIIKLLFFLNILLYTFAIFLLIKKSILFNWLIPKHIEYLKAYNYIQFHLVDLFFSNINSIAFYNPMWSQNFAFMI